MNKLQKDDGTITTDPKEILNMQSTFYCRVIYIHLPVNKKNKKIK